MKSTGSLTPPGVSTVTPTVPDPAGDTAVTSVDDTSNDIRGRHVTEQHLGHTGQILPVIVTSVPPPPDPTSGSIADTTGTGSGSGTDS